MAYESFADVSQGEVGAKMGGEFGEAQASSVLTGLAVAAVIIVISHVFQDTCFKSSEFHARNVTRMSCGALVDKSYSACLS